MNIGLENRVFFNSEPLLRNHSHSPNIIQSFVLILTPASPETLQRGWDINSGQVPNGF